MIGQTNIRERLRNNDVVISAMLRFPSPAAMEIMALAGVDLVIIDNEHYPFDEETMIDLVRAADVHHMACAVRVPNAEPARISQIMDYGVDGILVPSVDSYEEAMELVNAVKYAPIGTRGFCPITRAAAYGFGKPASEYAQFANDHSVVMVQIETREGLADLDRILSIPQVDCIDYGPSDLAASFGVPGRNDDPMVQAAVREIIDKARAAGKNVCEMAYTPEAVQEVLERGIRHVSIGSDQQIIAAGARAMIQAARD
ncbi:MAG: hypothetical protein HFF52_05710 [Lawsonibacter sp.]|nr:hypothetical protein [Lawsonibacter sp.]